MEADKMKPNNLECPRKECIYYTEKPPCSYMPNYQGFIMKKLFERIESLGIMDANRAIEHAWAERKIDADTGKLIGNYLISLKHQLDLLQEEAQGIYRGPVGHIKTSCWAVIGEGTLFTEDFEPGDCILIVWNEVEHERRVNQIVDDTHLYISEPFPQDVVVPWKYRKVTYPRIVHG
jgi:hypothetical protein